MEFRCLLFSLQKINGGGVMIKKIIGIVLAILLLPILAFAAADITFGWDGNTEPDLAGYRLYQSDTSGVYVYGEGSSNWVVTIGRGSNPGGKEEVTIQVADGTYFWVLTAFDNEEPSLESNPSNEITKKVSSPPAPPQGFWIKLFQIIMAWIKGLFSNSSLRFA